MDAGGAGSRKDDAPGDVSERDLLIRSTLEAVLARSAGRRDAGARAERLKAAVLMECAEKGHRNVTITGVAARARISTATIYADHADRDALLASALEMLFAILAADEIEIPRVDDPVEQVERLLIAHGRVYAEPLATWFFRLHVTLASSGHAHLHEIGRRVFEGIDAFWARFLGDLVARGLLEPLDPDVAVPVLLGPIERCTILSRLACGDDETGRPTLCEVARAGAQGLFAVFGGPAFRDRSAVALAAAATAARPAAPPSAPEPPVPPPATARLDDRFVAALDAYAADPSVERREAKIRLAAALECRNRGCDAASMIDVAERACVSTATLYKHFQDKRDLFTRVLEVEMDGWPTLDPPVEPAATPEEEAAALIAHVACAAGDPAHVWIAGLVMASELSGTPRVVALARAQRARIEAAFSRRLAAWERAGAIGPCDHAIAIHQLMGAVERSGVLASILFGRDAADPAKLARLAGRSASTFFRLHARPEAGGAARSA